MINTTSLKICCFSTYAQLIDKMNEFMNTVEGSHFQLYHDLNGFSILMGDVFIFDAAMDLHAVSIILKEKKKHRSTLLIGTIAEISAMDKETLTQFDQIIFKEHMDILFEARLTHALAAAKEHSELYLAEHYFNSLIDGLPDLVWVKSAEGAHLKVNNSFCRAVGKTKEQVFLRGHNYIWDLTEAEYEQGEYICLESEDETISRRQTCTFNEIVKTKAGLRNFLTYKTPIFHPETGEVIGTVGIARDVTDVNNVINEQNEFFNSIPIGLVVCEEENKIINSNNKAAEIFELTTLDLCNLKYEELRSRYFSKIDEGRKENYEEVEIISNGKIHIYEVATGEIKDIFKNSRGHYYIFHEVTAEREYQKQLFRHASTDSLTGLLNRKYFYNEIDEQRIYQDCNIFYLDVDNFKQINDTFSHQAGDTVIRIVARAIKAIFPSAFCVRMGGDEFVIALFESATEEELLALADKLQLEVDNMMKAEFGDTMFSNISIGISMNTHNNVTVDELISQADMAMYQSKNNGGRQANIYTKYKKS